MSDKFVTYIHMTASKVVSDGGCLVLLTDLEETLHILQNKYSTVRRIVL